MFHPCSYSGPLALYIIIDEENLSTQIFVVYVTIDEEILSAQAFAKVDRSCMADNMLP